jgi:hypothetical protein
MTALVAAAVLAAAAAAMAAAAAARLPASSTLQPGTVAPRRYGAAFEPRSTA